MDINKSATKALIAVEDMAGLKAYVDLKVAEQQGREAALRAEIARLVQQQERDAAANKAQIEGLQKLVDGLMHRNERP